MQPKTYHLRKDQIKDIVDHLQWGHIDDSLEEVPNGLYTFLPKKQNLLYYRRLLTMLNREIVTQQGLYLSAYILCLNTNNYYALMLHSECFKQKIEKQVQNPQVRKIISEQMYFASCILNINPKEYQIWNYKKDILTWITKYSLKIPIEEILEEQQEFVFYLMTNDDQRNYHAWDYMTFIARISGNLENKIKETDAKIFIDQYNDGIRCQSLWADCYSCWSYRFHLINDLPVQSRKKYLKQDCQKVMKFISNNKKSECAWNYLQGLYQHPDLEQNDKQEIMNKVILFNKEESNMNNSFAWQFLLENGKQAQKIGFLEKLTEIDPIRKDYYKYLKQIKFK